MLPNARPCLARRSGSDAPRGALLPLVLAALLTGIPGCGSDGEHYPGAITLVSAGPLTADPHRNGTFPGKVVEVSFGRQVDVYDLAGGRESLQHVEVVVDPALVGDGPDHALDVQGGRARLVVLHPAGTPAFDAALARAAAGLSPVSGLDAVLPVDAVLSLRFDDLIDVDALASEWELAVEREGLPVPVRLLPDLSRAVRAEDGRLLTTRAVLDPLVSSLDLARDPGAPVAALGWPGGELELHPRRADGSAAGSTVAFVSSGEGLAAAGAPRVLGEQLVDVLSVQPLGGGRVLVDYAFGVTACATAPAPGDLLEFPSVVAEVIEHDGTHDPSSGTILGVPLQLLAGGPDGVAAGPARYVAPFDPAGDLPACFVAFSPAPSAPPAQGVDASADLTVRFDQPMDPKSFEAFRTFGVERGWSAPPLEQQVVGFVAAGPGLERFGFTPSVPLSTVAPVSPAAYRFDLDGSPAGLTALDGTPLADDLPAVDFELDPAQPAHDTSGFVLAFDQLDEDGNGSPELRGQLILDLAAERLHTRPVTRFSTTLDGSQTLMAFMTPYPVGVTTPLSPFGSKLSSVWRYVDMGFSLLDEAYHNLDVEGLYWSPQGQVSADQFTELELVLGHSGFLPDEAVGVSLLPSFVASGLSNTYAANYLDAPAVVHPKAAYQVDPLDLITSASGTPLMPWPLNQGVPPSQYTYWTYRDTAVTEVGAPNGVGADPLRATQVLGGAATVQGLYAPDEVPSIGLPLLTEFRVWPDLSAQGGNQLRVALAINSSANPYFRTYSTGGMLPNGGQVLVDPDNQQIGSGGVDPTTGTPTPSRDNVVHHGQVDFVVRVSRAHTVWFDTGGAPSFVPAVIEPAAAMQPAGTQVVVAFRGADAITSAVPSSWEATTWLDPYGDSFDLAQITKLGGAGAPDPSFTVGFLNGDPGWKSDPSELDGARFLQARITMISNVETGTTPELAGLGIAFVN